MILVRLSFVVPYNVSNLVLGASNISLRDFCKGNLFIYPDVLLFAYIGSTASSVEKAISGESPISSGELVIMVLSGSFSFLALCYTTVIVRKIIKDEMSCQAQMDRRRDREEHRRLSGYDLELA